MEVDSTAGALRAGLPLRSRSTSPARSPPFLCSPSISLPTSPTRPQSQRSTRTSLRRTLSSPTLTSSQRAKSFKISPLSLVKGPTNSTESPGLHEDSVDSDHLRLSPVSPKASIPTGVVMQSIELASKSSSKHEALPKRTSSIQAMQVLRNSRSGNRPVMFRAASEFTGSPRGRTREIQNAKEKRSLSLASSQSPTLGSKTMLDPWPEIKPAPPLRLLRDGYIFSAATPACDRVPAPDMSRRLGKSAARAMQNGGKHRNGSLPNPSPLASHPPNGALGSKFSNNGETRPRVDHIDLPKASLPEVPASARPVPPNIVKARTKTVLQAYPKRTVFSPPPPSGYRTGAAASALPPLPMALNSPEEIKNAAEISIARQILISRRQRELLAPLAPKFARQPLRPILVDISSGAPVVRGSHHPLLENA